MIPDPPVMTSTDLWFLEAFYDLSSDRSVGMAVGPIPYTAIIAYVQYWQYDDQTAYMVIEIVKALDSVYMTIVNQDIQKGRVSDASSTSKHRVKQSSKKRKG